MKRVSPPVRLSIPPIPHIFRTLKSFADLRHTLYNLHLYSISRETQSEPSGATLSFWPQFNISAILAGTVNVKPNPTQDCLPATFTRHSELLHNFLLFTKLNSNLFLLVIAIGLLIPRPYLISELLRHQRRLPYWSFQGLKQSPANS